MTNRAKAQLDFTRRTILVRVKKSKWDGKAASEQAANKAADASNTKRDRVEAKIVLIESKYLQPITSPMNSMTSLLKSKSRPWSDGGWRMLYIDDYPDTRSALEKFQRAVRDAVQTTLSLENYTKIKALSEKECGNLLDGNFPTRERMLERYDVKILTDVVSSSDDCRIRGMSEEDIKEREQAQMEEINEGNRIMLRELAKMIETLHETLADDKKRYHGSEEGGYPILDNVAAMIDQCQRFNITGDPKLANLITKARKSVAEIDLTQCKEDKLARKSAAKEAKSVMEDLLSF